MSTFSIAIAFERMRRGGGEKRLEALAVSKAVDRSLLQANVVERYRSGAGTRESLVLGKVLAPEFGRRRKGVYSVRAFFFR